MADTTENKKDTILRKLGEKSTTKYQVYDNTLNTFERFRSIAAEMTRELSGHMKELDERIRVEYRDKGRFEFHLKIAADLLIISMHTNIFEFSRDHPIHKTSYLKDDSSRSFCGVIHIYNFLADSFKYNRFNDVGYLIGRVFINRENHYFVEGKRQIGFLYNDFMNNVMDDQVIHNILESAILYAIDFDLLCPPYDTIKEASVQQMKLLESAMSLKTGKRLGFRFQADHDEGKP
jgi:hypothetical protein